MKPTSTLEITRTIRGPLPRIPFENIAREILPKRYSLSVVVCGDALAQRLNTKYRKKTYVPNVLSFPLAKDEGEIVLNVKKAAQEARKLRVPVNARIAHLFAHGCCHLAGFEHGEKMERIEKRVLKKFGFPAPY